MRIFQRRLEGTGKAGHIRFRVSDVDEAAIVPLRWSEVAEVKALLRNAAVTDSPKFPSR